MNKTCARCEKTVYPTEELKCLDKTWHKGCFKCQECGMTLNMKTYKGYGKLPYCEAHVPKAKHTTMAETPELKRIAENTKIQSNVKYHADFERSKGKCTQVADDPETLRIKANTKIISNVAYHGELEKKAQMERLRQMNENGELVDVHDNYHQQIESYASEMLTPNPPPPHLPTKNHYQTPSQAQNRPTQANYRQEQAYRQEQPYKQESGVYKQEQHAYKQEQPVYKQEQPVYKQDQPIYKQDQPVYKQDQPVYKQEQPVYKQDQPAYKQEQQPVYKQEQYTHDHYYRQEYYNQYPKYDEYNQNQTDNQYQNQNTHTQTQYQSQNAHYSTQNSQYQAQNTQYQSQNSQYQAQNHNQYVYGQYQQQNYGVSSQQKIGRIQDYDPLSDGPRAPPNTQRASATLIYNSTSDQKRGAHQSQPQQSRQIGRVSDLDPLAAEPQLPPPPAHQTTPHNQRVYVAMYDYEANDSDEVSFREGDLISNVTSIDEGWMTGRVLRTGRTGMLPANYVELAPRH